ncbi:FAD/NAD(P)-binding protein [Xanthomonas translucens pv. graminis]|uniref:FAD/NAD(P)-binding protein n=1 Tax=Xanthomonas graminis TaxID=3390026 RepID=UPI00253F6B89|nr:FAD/NAD(P)-binding protein [Xanthomonas translucens]WIH04874.1 FAD/NAD(P)-binding protein [Xanthomonas translucens pv. graminis]
MNADMDAYQDSIQIAVVGLGPWGLCALERIVFHARASRLAAITVHVVEPFTPGTGIYEESLPDYLVMNNACGDIGLARLWRHGAEQETRLYDWAVSHGYRRFGRDYRKDPAGVPITPEDFLPRRLMGEYLRWYYRELLDSLPPTLKIRLHRTWARALLPGKDGGEEVWLDSGECLSVDHVILTFGNADAVSNPPADDAARGMSPYPVSAYLPGVSAETRVAVTGMGLVAIDVVMTLTQGMGGRFEECGERVAYHPSGREPSIFLISRSGLPFRQKSTAVSQVAARKAAFVFGPPAIDRLLARGKAAIDFVADVLPLLLREMSARYYVQAVYEAKGELESRQLAQRLRNASCLADFDAAIDGLARCFGTFDPSGIFYGECLESACSAGFQQAVCDAILREITPSARSGPENAACETFRVLRDSVRTVVEYGRLSFDSHQQFHSQIRGNIQRLTSGPPAWRLRQLLALIDAGVVQLPFGPSPAIHPPAREGEDFRIASTHLARPCVERIDLLIRGHLDTPRLGASASPLLASLHRHGRLVPARYGDTEVGSVDITTDAHPIDRQGRVQERVWVFGAITEGTLFSTLYIPSPKRGVRAYQDIDRCVSTLLGDVACAAALA